MIIQIHEEKNNRGDRTFVTDYIREKFLLYLFIYSLIYLFLSAVTDAVFNEPVPAWHGWQDIDTGVDGPASFPRRELVS